MFGQSSEDVTVLTDRRRRGQQSQRKLLETATTTGHRRLEELMAAQERYLERPDEPQQVDHGGDRAAYDDVGIPEYDEGNTRDDMMFPEDHVARAQMAADNEVEGDREASASVPPMPMDDRTLDDVALDDDPAADHHTDYYDTNTTSVSHRTSSPPPSALKYPNSTATPTKTKISSLSPYRVTSTKTNLKNCFTTNASNRRIGDEKMKPPAAGMWRRPSWRPSSAITEVAGRDRHNWILSTDYSAPENATLVGSASIVYRLHCDIETIRLYVGYVSGPSIVLARSCNV